MSQSGKKQRQPAVNESELPIVIKQESSLLDTLTDNQNDTIVGGQGQNISFPGTGRIGNRNISSQAEKTLVVGNEDKTSFQFEKNQFPTISPTGSKKLPPLVIIPGSSRVSQDKPAAMKIIDENPPVPKSGSFIPESAQPKITDQSEIKAQNFSRRQDSQEEYADRLGNYTELERNRISNVINIFKQQEAAADQLKRDKEKFQVKAKKPFEVEKSLDGAPFYFKELDRKFVVYDHCSLGMFDAKGWFRRKVVWLICWPWFDNFIIIMIAINSLLLAATDYSDRDNLTPRNAAIEASGLIFTITFTLEAVIKILAMGFYVHKNSYLRDPWNWLDFLVVCIGIIEFIPAIPAANLKALRTFRVLRPLRSINAFPSMRRLIGSLLASLPSLANAVVFMFFIFLLFGILGVQQFGGVLYQRCRYTPEPNKDPETGLYTDWPIVEEVDRLCGLNNQGNFKCPEPYHCGSPAQFSLSLSSENIQDQDIISYGIVTFDNLLRALITIFQMITLEGWTDMMYNLSDASQAWMAIFFCVLLVVVGSFFLLNVILAVIMDAFDQVDKNSAAEDARKRKDLIALKRLYGIIDSADEFSSEEEKVEIKEDGPQVINLSNIQNVHNLSKDISKEIVNLAISPKPSENNLRAVAPTPMSAASSPSKSEMNPFKRKKSKKIEIPDRAKENKILRVFFLICTHNAFNIGLTTCIIFNTALLAMDRHPIKPETQQVLESLNGILSWVFFFEMVIKMIGLGIKDYSADSFNLFDCTVVVISIIDLVISNVGVEFNGGGAISALRAVRLLRVFKLARSWTSFRLLLEKMIITLKDIRNFSVLMILFMFIYTLLGMELYAYKVVYNNEDLESVATDEDLPGAYPRANFNTFLTGFTTIFIVFIGEDWNSSMYDHVRARGYGSVFFFISLFILGNLVLLNLFLAILLKNFEEPPGKDEDEDEDVEGTIQKVKNLISNLCKCCRKKKPQENNKIQTDGTNKINKVFDRKQTLTKTKSFELKMSKQLVSQSSIEGNALDGPPRRNIFDDGMQRSGSKESSVERNSRDKKKKMMGKSKSFMIPVDKKDEKNLSFKTETFTIASLKKLEVLKSQQPKSKEIILDGKSLMLLSPDSKFRLFCTKIVGHQYFDSFILFLIGFSTILLTLENPLDNPDGQKAHVLAHIDIVVSAIFTIELLIKVIVYGFIINGPQSYMLNAWNIMDFIIVCFSLISIIFSGVDLGIIKVLRMLRVLRPLRMISRNPGLRIAVQSLINAIPDIGNVLVVSLLFLLLFAILGTNFYKGTFFSCHTENVPEELIDLIVDKFDCLDFGGEWVNVDQNFDNVMNSMITLFNVMTTEGWIGVMWSAVDSNQIDHVPIKNNKQNSVFFFILFMIVGSLFILNMFVGIVINVFNKEKETLQLNHLLTETQLDWCDVLITCYTSQPLIVFSSTGNAIIDLCHAIAINKIFDTFIFLCIVLNTICLAMTWYDEPVELAPILETINLVFNIIYTVEFIIKLIGFGWDYFSDGWNNFDMVIVFAAWLGMIINNIEGLDIGSLTTVIRSFRISRIFKIIKKYKNLRILFYTFIGAIPQLTNVGGLLFLLLFLYSVLGVFLFAEVQLQESLNIHANFQTFGGALITLFRMSTGESWNMIMYDCARVRSITFDCKQSQTYEEMQTDGVQGCGSPGKAYPFFISFMVVVSFIFLNLFIAIILESFNTTQDEQGLQVSQETLDKFNQFWSNFDPKGRGFIQVWQFPSLIKMILLEEIKLFHNLQEDIKAGNSEFETTDNQIFMFNLLEDNILLSVSAHMESSFKKLLEQYQKIKTDHSQEVEFEEGIKEIYMDKQELMDLEVKKLSMSPEEKDSLDLQKLLKKDVNKFIGQLQIPCYSKIKYYYYYDILEALSRNLFQILLTKERQKLLQEEEKSKDNSKESIYDSKFGDERSSLSQDGKSVECENDEERVQKEHENDIREGHLDQILLRLEQKGQKNNIFKYKEMQQLRAKRTMKVQDKLEQFGPEKSIIDSSQVIGAYIIVKFLQRRQEQKKRLQLEKQQKTASPKRISLLEEEAKRIQIKEESGEISREKSQDGVEEDNRFVETRQMEQKEQMSLSRNDSMQSGPGNIQGNKEDKMRKKGYANGTNGTHSSMRSQYVVSPLSSQN